MHHYPSPSPTAPVALVLPAMGAAARFYRPLAESLVAAGFAVVVADLRGTGDSTPPPGRASRYGYADLADDVGAVLAELKADDHRVLLVGHSLGGQAGLLHLATTPDAPVDGIALVAAAIPYWRSYPRHGRVVWAYTQAIGAVATVLRFWPGWTFGGRQARGVMTDWARTARTGRFPGADAAMADVTTPVLAISIDGDFYTPHEAVDHTAAKLRRAPVRRERVARIEAEGRPAHFAWVRAPEPVTTLIRDWFAARDGSEKA
ncbi:alpha/beta fold hydrolase [Asanoa sp. NPDC049518]|uniref:alpha/beta hydrolase family protein n=1 Tax=unclassified Asanoa TaxID=2685164 RepID=UPI003428B771